MPSTTTTYKLPYALPADRPQQFPTTSKGLADRLEIILAQTGRPPVASALTSLVARINALETKAADHDAALARGLVMAGRSAAARPLTSAGGWAAYAWNSRQIYGTGLALAAGASEVSVSKSGVYLLAARVTITSAPTLEIRAMVNASTPTPRDTGLGSPGVGAWASATFAGLVDLKSGDTIRLDAKVGANANDYPAACSMSIIELASR